MGNVPWDGMGRDRNRLLWDGMEWDRQICPMDNPGSVTTGILIIMSRDGFKERGAVGHLSVWGPTQV